MSYNIINAIPSIITLIILILIIIVILKEVISKVKKRYEIKKEEKFLDVERLNEWLKENDIDATTKSKEANKKIDIFMKRNRWEFEYFFKILQMIGIKFPISIVNVDEISGRIKISDDNGEIFFVSTDGDYGKINILNGKIKLMYTIFRNSIYSYSKSDQIDNLTINSDYKLQDNQCSFEFSNPWDDVHLRIKDINNINGLLNKVTIYKLSNLSEIESFLLSLVDGDKSLYEMFNMLKGYINIRETTEVELRYIKDNFVDSSKEYAIIKSYGETTYFEDITEAGEIIIIDYVKKYFKYISPKGQVEYITPNNSEGYFKIQSKSSVIEQVKNLLDEAIVCCYTTDKKVKEFFS